MGNAEFVPHATRLAGSAPEREALFCHGILGQGQNLRGLAKRLADMRPGWAFELVDLRGHGRSQAPPPPHTLARSAEDLLRLEKTLDRQVAAAVGHSFGGKVALAYAELRAAEGRPLDELWVLDASPGASPESLATGRKGTSLEVLDALRAAPFPFASREEFLRHLESSGIGRPTGEWLAMNLERKDEGLVFRLDLDVVDALITDYFERDLFPALEGPRLAGRIHFVLGGRSDAVSGGARARLEEMHRDGRIELSVLEEAGHNVHVDDPAGLLALLGRSFG